jgi:hypothetical protein
VEAAEAVYRRLLEYDRRVWGQDHPETIAAALSLAGVVEYKSPWAFAEAEAIYEDCLRAVRAQLTEHLDQVAAIEGRLERLQDLRERASGFVKMLEGEPGGGGHRVEEDGEEEDAPPRGRGRELSLAALWRGIGPAGVRRLVDMLEFPDQPGRFASITEIQLGHECIKEGGGLCRLLTALTAPAPPATPLLPALHTLRGPYHACTAEEVRGLGAVGGPGRPQLVEVILEGMKVPRAEDAAA